MKKVLIAGATGYLGRFVVQEFKRQGYWIRALARNPKRLEETGPFLSPAVNDQIDDVFVGEVTQPETCVPPVISQTSESFFKWRSLDEPI